MKDKRILDLVGKTNLDDLRGVYPRLSAIVSNDSSPIHYASAFNVSTVAIFGATASAMGFGPLADESSVVEIPHLSVALAAITVQCSVHLLTLSV